MTDFRDQLQPEIRAKQRALVRSHNNRIMLTASGFFLIAFLALQILRSHLPIGLTVLVADFALCIYVGLVLVPRADIRQCQRIGFTCPSCGDPLYDQSSIHVHTSSLITRGICPHCEHSLLATNVAYPNRRNA